MTRIERIQPSLHKKDRVLVYLTGGDLLRITPEELLRFGLRPGQELTEDVLEELRRAAARSQTRQRAAELAAGRGTVGHVFLEGALHAVLPGVDVFAVQLQ